MSAGSSSRAEGFGGGGSGGGGGGGGGGGHRASASSGSESSSEFEHIYNSPQSASWSTDGIESLGSTEQAQILSIIDGIRDSNVSKEIDFPRLVVCGDQSSGKSSVLQAIAGIPFPHSSDQCTRFATEVILKRSSFVGVTVSIKSYNTKETTVFKTKRDLTSVDDLSEVIRKAGDKMERTGAFSKDILQIEISDPTKKPLILVDLPGLIHNGPDEAVVVGMVEDYMKNTRTVILAVVTAGGDPDPQAVLKLAKIHDPEGRRTFGIITKPDKSDGNTNLQRRLIGMAKNLDKNFKFDLGWHVLMNGAANDGEQQLDLEKRAKEEKRFFEAGPWSGVPKGNCCIGPLRQRLSTMLLDHVKQELKGIKGDISAAIARCQKERADMGELHQDLPSKRNFLVETGKKYHKICNQAITGLYTTSRFFGTGFSSNPEDDALYLRGRIKNLNVAFAYTFWKYGHHKEIEDCSLIPQGLIDTDESTDHFDDCRVEPDEITRKYAVVDWVKPVAKKSRGVEIVDGRNPTLVKFLFCEQSQKWETLAYRHLDECSAACRKFLRLVLEAVVPEAREEIRDSLHDWIDRKLERRVADAKREMASIIADCRDCFPIVNNYQYYDEVGIARVKRAGNGSARQTITSLRHTLGSVVGLPTQAELVSGLTEVIGSLDGDAEEVHEDPEDQRCEASLDEMLAYYKTASRRFVDDVVVQVIERKLVAELDETFSAYEAAVMTDEEVANIVQESPYKQQKINELNVRLKSLERAADACRRYSRWYVHPNLGIV